MHACTDVVLTPLQVRDEIRSHAQSLGYNAVIGYYEHSSLEDPLFLLSACGLFVFVSHANLLLRHAHECLQVQFELSFPSCYYH